MHKFITPVSLIACPKCKKPILAHAACKYCGFYKGKEVVNVMAKMTTSEKKVREKEMKAQEKEAKHGNVNSMQDLSKKV
jgi:large subunit ribosomal protein L32